RTTRSATRDRRRRDRAGRTRSRGARRWRRRWAAWRDRRRGGQAWWRRARPQGRTRTGRGGRSFVGARPRLGLSFGGESYLELRGRAVAIEIADRTHDHLARTGHLDLVRVANRIVDLEAERLPARIGPARRIGRALPLGLLAAGPERGRGADRGGGVGGVL